MRVAVSIRYLQVKGTSHAHIYLYSGDGKLIRQLTKSEDGQDIDPAFSPRTVNWEAEKLYAAEGLGPFDEF